MLHQGPLRKPVALPLPVSLSFTLSVSVALSFSVSFPVSVSVFVTVFVAGLGGDLDGPGPLVVNLHRRHICRRADSLLSHRLSDRLSDRLSGCGGVGRARGGGLKRRRVGVGDVKGAS